MVLVGWADNLYSGGNDCSCSVQNNRQEIRMIDIAKGRHAVFVDLDVSDEEEVFIKAKLVRTIHELILERGWTLVQAGLVLGMPEQQMSKMLSGELRGINKTRLLDCLTRLGRDVKIQIGPERSATRVGHVYFVLPA